MPETPTKLVVDVSTGEKTTVELTAEEIVEMEALATAHAQELADRESAAEALEALKTSARAKLVAGEPLTAEEAATIVI